LICKLLAQVKDIIKANTESWMMNLAIFKKK
jgi:hypothetical protein